MATVGQDAPALSPVSSLTPFHDFVFFELGSIRRLEDRAPRWGDALPLTCLFIRQDPTVGHMYAVNLRGGCMATRTSVVVFKGPALASEMRGVFWIDVGSSAV